MITKNNEEPRPLITEHKLRMMLANDMVDAAQQLLDLNPHLQYKIEKKEDKWELVDLVFGAELWLKKFITVDAATLEMKKDAMKASKSSYEVLIHGETGTGKECIAHAMIGDRDGAFVSINCAGLPENLIESELFGHTAGAFTGAIGQRQGLMATAKDGVFFMDEIGELPLQAQAKLLRVLQEKKVRMVGDKADKDISCRFVSATNKDLKDMVVRGLFRADLYARISTIEFSIKPLVSRQCDIEPILKHIAEVLGIGQKFKDFWPIFQQALVGGTIDLSLNVRSLERALKRWDCWGHL